jgi:FtsZ-interacting cell division protein ZipA
MTTTHYVLIGLAVALVAGLLFYNYLQERRFRKQAERMFANRRDEVELGDTEIQEGMKDGRIEPRIHLPADDAAEGAGRESASSGLAGAFVQSIERLPDAEVAPVAETEAAAGQRSAAAPAPSTPRPTAAAKAPPADQPAKAAEDASADEVEAEAYPTPSATSLPPSPLDPAVEYVARLRFTQAERLSFSRLIEALRRLGKPIRAYGWRQDGVWEVVGPNPAASYDAIELGLQLADRSGPVSDPLLDSFCRALYQFATEHGGAVSCPERRAAVERARELDRFCMEVDVLIGLNIVARDRQPFAGEKVDAMAVEAGMKLGDDGIYVLRDEAGRMLFSLANQEDVPFPAGGKGLTTQGISLIFDVPRIADGMSVFDRMTVLGFQLAEKLNARIVDDTGRAVSQDSLAKDRQRLSGYYARMDSRGIKAGSERALRLFA